MHIFMMWAVLMVLLLTRTRYQSSNCSLVNVFLNISKCTAFFISIRFLNGDSSLNFLLEVSDLIFHWVSVLVPFRLSMKDLLYITKNFQVLLCHFVMVSDLHFQNHGDYMRKTCSLFRLKSSNSVFMAFRH